MCRCFPCMAVERYGGQSHCRVRGEKAIIASAVPDINMEKEILKMLVVCSFVSVFLVMCCRLPMTQIMLEGLPL